MRTILSVLSLFVLGCFFAGCYGMLHDQISYTVSPEYFHQFKFKQFQINPIFHGRDGAAIVGWYATWWMGALLSIVLIPAGYWLVGKQKYYSAILKSYGLVTLSAIVVGVVALLVACIYVDQALARQFVRNWQDLNGPIAFMCVGVMHTFSYLGGGLGLIIGLWYLWRSRATSKGNL